MPQRGQVLKSPSYLVPAPLEQYALVRPSCCLQQKSLWIHSFCRTVISEVVFSGGVVYASKFYWQHNYTLPWLMVLKPIYCSAYYWNSVHMCMPPQGEVFCNLEESPGIQTEKSWQAQSDTQQLKWADAIVPLGRDKRLSNNLLKSA